MGFIWIYKHVTPPQIFQYSTFSPKPNPLIGQLCNELSLNETGPCLPPCSVWIRWLSSDTPAAASLFLEAPPNRGRARRLGCSRPARTRTSPRTVTEWIGWNVDLRYKRQLCPLAPVRGTQKWNISAMVQSVLIMSDLLMFSPYRLSVGAQSLLRQLCILSAAEKQGHVSISQDIWGGRGKKY